MASAKQKAWRAKFARMYGGKKRSQTSVRASTQPRRRRNTMVRYRRRGRSRGGMGMGKLLKAAAFGIGAAMILPRFVPIDSKLAGAAGGFFGGGPIGAVIGYVAPSVLGGVMGGSKNGSSATAWVG